MKTEVTVFYKKNLKTGEVLDIQSISSCYSGVVVQFSSSEVTIDDLKALKWPSNLVKDYIGSLAIDGYFAIQGEAKDIPSFGNIVCGTQTIEVEIDESKIGGNK